MRVWWLIPALVTGLQAATALSAQTDPVREPTAEHVPVPSDTPGTRSAAERHAQLAADPQGAPSPPAPSADIDPAALPANRLVAVTASGRHDFVVEIADDPIERMEGLMFREQMARDHGMLFDFGQEDERSFWMKNTILPLDIIFVRSDGTVLTIKQGVPFSLESVASDGPARFVVELNEGVAAEIGLVPGNQILHRRIAR